MNTPWKDFVIPRYDIFTEWNFNEVPGKSLSRFLLGEGGLPLPPPFE